MRRLIIFTFTSFLTISIICADIGFCQVTIHERQFLLNNSPEYMTITMGGLLDGENTYTESNSLWGGIGFEPMISLRISNLGNKRIHSPRLVINNERRWFNFNTFSAEFLTGVQNNKEKALSSWKLMRDNRFHYRTPVGGCEAADPLKSLGIYGYLTCGYASTMMTSIGTGLGYNGRIWHLRYQPQPQRGHAISEIDFGDGYVIVDLDAHVFFVDYDNQTLIGYNEVVADNFLVRRTHFFGKSRLLGLDMGVMYNQNNSSSGAGNCLGHTLDISLRPGESIIYDWADANLLHHPNSSAPNPIPWHIANSKLVYQPLFETAELYDLLDIYENICVTNNIGQSPLIHADSLNGTSYFEIKVESPFVMLDGSIKIHGFQGTLQDTLKLEFSLDRNNWNELWISSTVGSFVDSVNFGNQYMLNSLLSNDTWQKDSLDFFHPTQSHSKFPLDSVSSFNKSNSSISNLNGKYNYYLRFTFSPTNSVTACGIDSIRIATIIQTSKRFMPRLTLNENQVEYSDADTSDRNIKLEIIWRESTENTPPERITFPIFPSNGSEPDHNQFTFVWNEPTDPNGDEIVDYEFQLSDRPDMRFPLSTNFEMYISAFGDTVEPKFNIPWPGLLNDGTTYYWRVRPKDINGAWGPWSPVWSFIPHGVMMPLSGEVVTNGNEFYLRWQPNHSGYVPTFYEVHGSNEPNGFTADSSTIIGESYQLEFNISGDIYDFYRVVAIDSQGQASGPSRLIHFGNITSSDAEPQVEHPVTFELIQNYPNPFNPYTTIQFDLPHPEKVMLTIYNLQGKIIKTLVNDYLTAGRHKYQWKPQGLSSGLYFYRISIHSDKIETGAFKRVKKLMYIK